MSRYYHVKAELCETCKIRGEEAMPVIIHGLSEELKSNARATKCILLKEDLELSSGATKMVPVKIKGEKPGEEVTMKAKVLEVGHAIVAIPSGVLR